MKPIRKSFHCQKSGHDRHVNIAVTISIWKFVEQALYVRSTAKSQRSKPYLQISSKNSPPRFRTKMSSTISTNDTAQKLNVKAQ